MNSLDSILGGGEAVSEGKTTENEQVAQAATEGEGQTEQTTEGQSTEGEGDGNRVPVAALQAERQKSKRYTEEVSSLRQEIAERDAAWERRIAQLVEAGKPKPEPPPEQDFFVDPKAATHATAKEYAQQHVDPRLNDLEVKTQLVNKRLAMLDYGKETVLEAEREFMALYKNGQLSVQEFQQVTGSDDRFSACSEWYQQRKRSELMKDPRMSKILDTFRGNPQLLEKIESLEPQALEQLLVSNGGNGQQPAQQRQQVMPSNLEGARNVGSRTGPAWTGPAPLEDIFNRARSPG